MEVGFISAALAAGKSTKYIGYAQFRSDPDNVVFDDKITSDGGGTYTDRRFGLSGEDDVVKLTVENRSRQLFRSDVVFGAYGEGYVSSRRVHFRFDVLNDAIESPGLGSPLYDILAWTAPEGDTARERRDLNAPVIHVLIAVSIPGSKPMLTYFGFIVDGIDRQELMEVWEVSSTELEEYRFDKGKDGEEGTGDDPLGYYLNYEGCTVRKIEGNEETEKWDIEFDSGQVKLSVYKRGGGGKKGKGKGENTGYDAEFLATYNDLQFGYTTWHQYDVLVETAPSKHKTLSATWGRIRDQTTSAPAGL